MEKKYYLAYGSNLNVRQMRYRCPTAKPIGITAIPDYQLLYKGSKTGAYLTIEPKKNGIVPIAVWEVTADDEKRLDAYEGCPTFYYKKEVRLPVKLASGKTKKLTAFVYIMHVLYCCSASRPATEGQTTEESKEVKTETLSLKASALPSGLVKSKTCENTDQATYDNWYNAVYMPTAATNNSTGTRSASTKSGGSAAAATE